MFSLIQTRGRSKKVKVLASDIAHADALLRLKWFKDIYLCTFWKLVEEREDYCLLKRKTHTLELTITTNEGRSE